METPMSVMSRVCGLSVDDFPMKSHEIIVKSRFKTGEKMPKLVMTGRSSHLP